VWERESLWLIDCLCVGVSIAKARAIIRRYPTFRSLFEAYQHSARTERVALLQVSLSVCLSQSVSQLSEWLIVSLSKTDTWLTRDWLMYWSFGVTECTCRSDSAEIGSCSEQNSVWVYLWHNRWLYVHQLTSDLSPDTTHFRHIFLLLTHMSSSIYSLLYSLSPAGRQRSVWLCQWVSDWYMFVWLL